MKKNLLLLVFIPALIFSQNKKEAEIKVNEGIILHDKGKYNEALNKYEEALNLDKNNLHALSEKAMTLEASKQYNEAIEICKLAINTYPDQDVKTVYITYANSLDHSKQTQQALKIYDEGIKKYPNYYQLYFNKGIALINSNQTGKGLEAFQKSAKLNPNHKGSFNALAALNADNRIISILCSLRYLSIDNKSELAKTHLKSVLSLMNKGVSQKDDNSINLYIDPKTVDKAANDKKSKNDFSATDMVLSMSSALAFDEKNKDKTDCQKFTDKLSAIFATLDETQKGQSGFYWEFLAPFFIEMNQQKLTETFAYLAFSSKQNEDVKYQKENSEAIDRFYTWSENYTWK